MNEPKYLKAWLLFFLAGTIGGFLIGAVLGGIAGFILALLNPGDPTIMEKYQPIFQVGGFLVGIPISYIVYKWSVSKYIIPQIQKEQSDT